MSEQAAIARLRKWLARPQIVVTKSQWGWDLALRVGGPYPRKEDAVAAKYALRDRLANDMRGEEPSNGSSPTDREH